MTLGELIPFSASTTAVIALGALAAGFVTGLAGFGTALVALAFWLHVIDPRVAGPLVCICAVASQLASIRIIWRGMRWRRLYPFLGAGLLGLALGLWLQDLVQAEALKVLVGVVLITYSTYNLLHGRIHVPHWGGSSADSAIGLIGGVLGGSTGLAGVLPTMWCAMRGWPSDEQRGTFQPYTLTILALAIPGYALNGSLNAQVGAASIFAIPLSLLAGWGGAHCYTLLDPRQFRLVVLWTLLVSGALLLF